MAYSLKIDDKAMRKFIREMPAASKRSVARSLNKAITQTRTLAAREVSQKRNILVGRARQDMSIQKATPSRPVAAINASGQPIKAIEVKGAKRQTKQGVVAKIEGKGKPHLFKGAFIAIMKSGHIGIFRRASNPSLPIKEQTLPSVSSTMVQDQIEARLQVFGSAVYEKELLRLIKYEMGKAGAR